MTYQEAINSLEQPNPGPLGDGVVADIMTGDVKCVEKTTSVEAIAAMFTREGFGATPVLDGDGRVVGVVSKTDLVRERDDAGDVTELARVPDLESGLHVHDSVRTTAVEVMTPLTFFVHPNDSIMKAVALMAYESIHRTLVLDNDCRPVGVLSALDVLRWLADTKGYLPFTRANRPKA